MKTLWSKTFRITFIFQISPRKYDFMSIFSMGVPVIKRKLYTYMADFIMFVFISIISTPVLKTRVYRCLKFSWKKVWFSWKSPWKVLEFYFGIWVATLIKKFLFLIKSFSSSQKETIDVHIDVHENFHVCFNQNNRLHSFS